MTAEKEKIERKKEKGVAVGDVCMSGVYRALPTWGGAQGPIRMHGRFGRCSLPSAPVAHVCEYKHIYVDLKIGRGQTAVEGVNPKWPLGCAPGGNSGAREGGGRWEH